jgi:manganese/zinc/iron transport system ATP- binding protein
VQDADTLLLDEPFAGVDLTTEKILVELLKEEKKKGKTIFVVHHDLPTVEQYFDWLILLNTRLIAAGPVAEVFSKENLSNAFGKSQFLFDEAARLSAKSTTGLV